MTKNEFLDYMKYTFKSLEQSQNYYWEYRDQLKQFELIIRLAVENNLIKPKAYNRARVFVRKELSKYGEK